MRNTESNFLKLQEIQSKAAVLLAKYPDNEKVKELFVRSFFNSINENIDIFGTDPSESIDNLGKSEITVKSVVDIPFGTKAQVALGSVTMAQNELIRQFEAGQDAEMFKIFLSPEKYSAYLKQKGPNIGTDVKTGDLELKYPGAIAKQTQVKSTSAQQTSRIPLVARQYKLNKDLGKFEASKLADEFSAIWVSDSKKDLLKSISYDFLKATLTPQGAGQLEFLARMYIAASQGLDQTLPVSSKISTSEAGISHEQTREQETFLLNIGDGKLKGRIAERCYSSLYQFLEKAALKILQPILKQEHIEEFIRDGIVHTLDKLAGKSVEKIEIDDDGQKISKKELVEEKYDTERANFGAWAFQVIRNYCISQLRKITIRKFDISAATTFTRGLAYPFRIVSKIPPEYVDDGAHYSDFEEIEDGGKKKGIYIYDNENDLLQDLMRANGYMKSVESNCKEVVEDGEEEIVDKETGKKETRGRKRIYVPCNPVYWENIDRELRKNFLTSFARLNPTDVGYEGEEYEQEFEGLSKREEAIINFQLSKIVSDIYDIIITDNDSYGQKNIKAFMRNNPKLTKNILFKLLHFGVYKFEKGAYKWKTNPELFIKNFIQDLRRNYPKGEEFPSVVKTKPSKDFPEGNSISIDDFIQILRGVFLGSGTGGGKGFLLKNPNYLNQIYNLLSSLPKKRVLGRSEPGSFDENILKIKNLISELYNEINNYNKQIINNYTKNGENK